MAVLSRPALQSTHVPDKTFTIPEARALLPRLSELFDEMRRHRRALVRLTKHVDRARAAADLGGGTPYGAAYLEHASAFAIAYETIGETGVVVKDIVAGLVDFPHEYEGRIVYLCWRFGEESLDWWHEIEDGFAGRQPLVDAVEKAN